MTSGAVARDRLEGLWARGRAFLGVDVAIMGGAMTWVSERTLVSAISNAGGFGVIACGSMDPGRLREEIRATRALPTYRTMPVINNEDPNFHFGDPSNHILAALDEYVSWGYYDQGENNYSDGFQAPPVNWRINTDDKKQFAAKVKEITLK